MNNEHICFRSFNENDLHLIHHWFQEPIVRQWYARNKSWVYEEIQNKYLPRILGKENVPGFIVYFDKKPIRFIQYCSLDINFPEGVSNLNNPLFLQYKTNEIAGVDLYIGNDEYRNQGLGVNILNEFIKKFLVDQFKLAIVDPDKNNSAAIRCYEKSGFIISSYSDNSQYIIMTKKLK